MAKNDDDDHSISPGDGSRRPKARSPKRDEEEEESEDDEEERRARRRARRKREREDEGDATGGVIPYKNPRALASYYCGVFGLISCFLGLGIFGFVPIVLGIMGLQYAKKHPEASGQVHAIVGILLGILELLSCLGMVGFIVVGVLNKK